MIIPSIAQVQNLVAATLGYGYWTLVDHETQEYVTSFDSFYDFDFNAENAIANYPLEQGQFVTYNKQRNPFNISLTLIKSGLTLPYEKKRFVDALKKYSNNALLIDVITPHGSYLNCTLSGLSFKNSPDENNDIIMAKVNIKEVMFFTVDAVGTVKISNASNRLLQGLKSMVGL